jgi:mono/diheme cytochrome c family protein
LNIAQRCPRRKPVHSSVVGAKKSFQSRWKSAKIGEFHGCAKSLLLMSSVLKITCVSAATFAVVTAAATAASAPSKGPLTFEAHIRPILKAHCFQCHGEGEKLKGGLDLRLRHLALKGGNEGPAIVPGKPEKSLLFTQVHEGEMPKGEKKLSAEQVETIRKWIASGARTARPEPAVVGQGPHFTEEERSFWLYQPVKRPVVPNIRGSQSAIRNSIDTFLLAKLREKKLSFSLEAGKAVLIRRATFDLTGLPPTPEEVARFLADHSTDAYEKLLDRLLASPHYGERWGRHWLDVAGYADSEGYATADTVRNYSYKYRDYVIRSFNADKPFDQFIQEQLAGDELVPLPHKNLSPDQVEKLVATGFLRNAPDGTGSSGVVQNEARNAVVADTLKIVSTSLMGLTLGCAQCHDHRYDPIPQTDYYRLRAVFEPAYDWKNWRAPNARLISLLTDDERAKAAEVEKEAAKLDTERTKKQEAYISETLEKELAKLPEDQREPMREAYKTPVAKRSPEQVKMLKDHPTVANLTSGSLYLYNQKMADELKKVADEAGSVRAKKPVEEFVAALTEVPGKVPPTVLFNRGNFEEPKQAVEPGELTILASFRKTDFPVKDPALSTTGRRLALARSLTDGSHPLTARVLVNRVWSHHFGRGIVGTPGDFGYLGERPTHPELLDWLASEFVAQGWSMKRLHKLIMTSTAYRQVSLRDSKKERLDPDNRLLWRMPVRRLEAEEIRDAMLAVSGKLNSKQFGKPVPVMEDEVGQVVVGIDTNDTAGRPSGKFIPLNGEEFRRSIYVQARRSKPLGIMETFDAPRMEPNCDARNASTVAPQSLALMNGEFAVEQAKFLAERVAKEADELEKQAGRAWELAYGRTLGNLELKSGLDFLARQRAHFVANPLPAPPPPAKGKPTLPPPPTAEQLALASYCHALLSANRFIYVE